jgi:hypothetical protein
MFEMKDYKDNVLAITNEQVASDWRLGLLRALGKVAQGARPSDSTGSWGVTVAGSNREHVMGNWGNVPPCPLVEIYDVREEKGEEYIHDSFNGGSTKDIMILSANATCACGRIVKHPVAMDIEPGELIYRVTHADEEWSN